MLISRYAVGSFLRNIIHMKEYYAGIKKIKIELLYGPVIPF